MKKIKNDICFSCKNGILSMPMAEKKCLAYTHVIHDPVYECAEYKKLGKDETMKVSVAHNVTIESVEGDDLYGTADH